jgi:hypothetical protein
MGYQVAFGFGGQIFAGIEVFYVDPLVMTVPAIERYNAVAIPVHCAIQKDGSLAFFATPMNFVIILMLVHFPPWLTKEQAVFLMAHKSTRSLN